MLLTVTVLLAVTSCGNNGFPNGVEIPEYTPEEDIVVKKGYTASYNHLTLVPNWVAWELTKKEATCFNEYTAAFQSDSEVLSPKANPDDYRGSGWDKGHLAPVRDMRWDECAIKDAYLMTNICPQDHKLNAGAWRKIEVLTHRIVYHYGNVYVVCGPIFEYNGTDLIRKIGKNEVHVPDAFFKAIAVKKRGKYLTAAFVLENEALNGSPLTYAITVDSLEAVIGRDLFPTINGKYEATLGLDELLAEI